MCCGPGRFGDWLVPDAGFEKACLQHDKDYAQRRHESVLGPHYARLVVDQAFRDRMLSHSGYADKMWKRAILKTIAHVYYHVVRWTGWWRWGK